ncbi:MAG TPA: 6-pyruvoyl-tetrahydropterin synthase-related protein, partial [Chloroflexota bacterium]|nr:6-pyruvoyl-tetrahydropterin synthase-related protein [Chloroflexota bacterium]
MRGPIFASSDGVLHLYQLVEFDSVLRSGVLFPRWAPDFMAGYGQPLFIFYAPLLYYLAAGFHWIGLTFADALKATVLLGMLASLLGMYVFGRELWGRWGGFLSAIAYLYVPYRFVNTYLDGELSQTLAWAWLPWLFFACWRALRTRSWGWGLVAGLSYAGLIYTHSVTSWLTTLFLGLALAGLLIARQARLRDELRLGACLALGVGLAAPYWLPAVVERTNIQLNRVQTGSYDFHTNLVPLGRTLSADVAHVYSTYVGVNGPAQLGLVQTIAAIAGLLAALACWQLAREGAGLAVVFAALGAIAFVLMLPSAAVFWQHVPFSHSLQFPDRLLGMMGFLLAALAGGLGVVLRRLPGLAAALLCAAAAGVLIYGATVRLDVSYVSLPASVGPLEVVESEQATGAIATTAKGEYTPVWMAQPALSSPLTDGYLSGHTPSIAGGNGSEVQLVSRRTDGLTVRVSSPSAGAVELPVAYYPGWTVSLAGASAAVKPDSRGLISVNAPAGDSAMELHFGATADRRGGELVGLLALLALVVLVWRVGAARIARLRLPVRGLAAAGSGVALLALAAYLTPGKLQLDAWPASRPELVSYKDWLQLLGADVTPAGDHIHVSAVFRTGAAQSAFPLAAVVRLMTRETEWSSASQPMTPSGWFTMAPRRFDMDLPIAPGTPAGTYLLELQLRHEDGSILGPDWALLTYDAPRVGPVTLGPVTLTQTAPGEPAATAPDVKDFGPLQLLGWQPPAQAKAGDFVPLSMWWRAAGGQPGGDWGVSIHIVDGQGHVWAG